MSGAQQMDTKRWSTRQRFVVLTFETPQQATLFDLRGGSTVESPMGGFDIKLVDSSLLEVLMWACRDVIDEWDEDEPSPQAMTMWVDRLRRALHELRQGAMT